MTTNIDVIPTAEVEQDIRDTEQEIAVMEGEREAARLIERTA